MTDDAVVRLEDGVLVVAGRRYPWAEVRVFDADFDELLDLDATHRLPPHHMRHAWVALENGYKVSINWGTGTYSDNHDAFLPGFAFTETPQQAEVGVLRADLDELVSYTDDSGDDESVYGYIYAEEINSLIAWVATWPSGLTHVTLPPPPPERNP